MFFNCGKECFFVIIIIPNNAFSNNYNNPSIVFFQQLALVRTIIFKFFGKEKIEMWDKMDMIKCKQRYGSTANSKINYSYTELLALKNATEMKGIFNI
ncbi:hypothetical protein FACS1894156_7580 [Bacteroidia bacterium]|nr:hypothetical protein FACS1894156_7580 [Bacteroidia bacterium]